LSRVIHGEVEEFLGASVDHSAGSFDSAEDEDACYAVTSVL
jgi:hypothetical protein